MQQEIHLTVQDAALSQNILLNVLIHGQTWIPLLQIVRNAAKNRIGQHLVSRRIGWKEFYRIIKAHLYHLVDSRGSPVQRILFCKQILFDEVHCAPAEDNHHIIPLQPGVPQILQNRRNALIPVAHIRKLINHKELLVLPIRQL